MKSEDQTQAAIPLPSEFIDPELFERFYKLMIMGTVDPTESHWRKVNHFNQFETSHFHKMIGSVDREWRAHGKRRARG